MDEDRQADRKAGRQTGRQSAKTESLRSRGADGQAGKVERYNRQKDRTAVLDRPVHRRGAAGRQAGKSSR